ncbi:hypothetical protein V3C99_006563 [Haemonchus contortus]
MYSPLLNRSSAMSTAMESTSLNDSSTKIEKRFSGDNVADSPAKAPSFLFGQKRRSMAPATPSYLNNPYSGQNAPSNDIFASPVPSQLRGEPAGNSGKSVHWSPALVQERAHPYDISRSTLKSLPSQSGQFAASLTLSPAPPLRSLKDDIEPVRKMSRRSMHIRATDSSATTASASQPATEQLQSSAETWVTVYGFPPEQAANVLKHFSRHGEIISHQVPNQGNWMHIRYSCPVHARQALCRNASLIDSSLRVGVIPCPDKDIVGTDFFNSKIMSPLSNHSFVVDQSISEEAQDEILSISSSKENQDFSNDSMSRSRLSAASRAGMRSLSMPYESRQNNKDAQPVKQDTIMNRLWTAVGL